MLNATRKTEIQNLIVKNIYLKYSSLAEPCNKNKLMISHRKSFQEGVSMPSQSMTESGSLRASTRFRAAKKELLESILDASQKMRAIRPSSSAPEIRDA